MKRGGDMMVWYWKNISDDKIIDKNMRYLDDIKFT